jgi:hypothetical protein
VTGAFKFLRPGRIGPFTRAVWPEPGSWMESPSEPVLCRSGIHALRVSALPYWCAEELWHVELHDVTEAMSGVLLARRGRLVRQVSAWNDDAAREFADACLRALPHQSPSRVARERASHAVEAARDVTAAPSAAWVAHVAAKAAEADRPGGYEQERGRQVAFLTERLGIDPSAER